MKFTLPPQLDALQQQALTTANRRWLRIAMRVAGAAAIAALIWFATPFIGFGSFHPFEDALPRLAVIFLELVVVGGLLVFDAQRRSASSERLAAALSVEDSDAPVLADRMRKALSVLRARSGGRSAYLYDLPWYVLIGPPGSGKTTALINSGLKFPLLHGSRPDAIAGVGGTRYCDWWFTEDAVLIDTAGRYTTQDSDMKADQASWLAFLDLLKRSRSRQPINGVLVAISLEDLLTLSPKEVAGHANAIRERIHELNRQLGIDFPVYALFTKADLVIGFMEFFNDLDERGRSQVWGATFRKRSSAVPLNAIEPEFDALVERVNEHVPTRLETERDAATRVLLFGFPAQLAALKKQMTDFLAQIFDPARYRASAPLRGFYFTSGTQQGTPIDKLLGAMSKSFAAEGVSAPVYSGRGKSFFLTDLVRKVIIGEAGFVSDNVGRKVGAVATFLMVFIVAPLAAGLFWINYAGSANIIAQSKDAASAFSQRFPNLASGDRDLMRMLPALDALRSLPQGYGVRVADADSSGIGFDQMNRLHSSAETAYQKGLERLLRPRLIYRLEAQLNAHANDAGYLYDTLKTYMMLGRLKTVDRRVLLSWMERDWREDLYPDAKYTQERAALEKHLIAMLDLDTGDEGRVPLDSQLIEKTQATLAHVNIAQRVFETMKTHANAELRADWSATDAAGAGALNVFDDSLRQITVPYFYTKAGFEKDFIGRLEHDLEMAKNDRWVLGRSGEQPQITSQYDRLPQDVTTQYARASITAWRNAIDNLRVRNIVAGERPTYLALHAAAQSTSPFAKLLESVYEETNLADLRDVRGSKGYQAAESLAASLQVYHKLVSGSPGSRPIDTILADLGQIQRDLSSKAIKADDQTNRRLNSEIDKLTSDADARLPQPFQSLLKRVANDVRQESSK
jgi:type VI secretion system protein ImpL